MSQAVTFLFKDERRREEAATPNPAANVAEANDFLNGLRRMHASGGISTARLREILPSYLTLCEEHLEEARAFEQELMVDAPPKARHEAEGLAVRPRIAGRPGKLHGES